MKYTLILFLFYFGWVGCHPKPVQKPVKPIPTKPEDSVVLWKIPLFQDTAPRDLIHFDMLLNSHNQLVYSLGTQGNPYNYETLRCIDVKTREVIWEWTGSALQSWEVIGDLAYINQGRIHDCLNLLTGDVIWHNSHENISGEPFSSHYKDLIFSMQDYGSSQGPDRTDFRIANIHAGDWQIIFTSQRNAEGYSGSVQAPTAYIDSLGDTILVFQDRRYGMQLNPWYKIELKAYNLTQRKMVWENFNISNEVSNIVNPPRIDEAKKRVYFYTDETAFCFDLETGAEIWKVDSGLGGNLGGSYFLHDGKLMTINDGGMFMALDEETGTILFSEKQGGCCVENAKIYGDRIYFTDSEIFIADVNTGKRTWKYWGIGDFRGGVAVDEANKVMYASTDYFLYCLKLPEY